MDQIYIHCFDFNKDELSFPQQNVLFKLFIGINRPLLPKSYLVKDEFADHKHSPKFTYLVYVTRSRGMGHMSAIFNFDFSI